MFETSFQKERIGLDWGVFSACLAFILLLVIGYLLIA